MRAEFRSVPLGAVTTLITKGTTPSMVGRAFTEAGINFIKAESVTLEGTIDESVFAHIDEETHRKLRRSQIEEGDILFSIAGMKLGKSAVAQRRHLPANTNQAVAIIRADRSRAVPEFLHYSFLNPQHYKYVNALTAQAAQPNINLAQIRALPISIPPIPVQRRIAEILSTYDDLIENCQQRIRILETMARRLYCEWFVEFRFPGHETHPSVASSRGRIPVGWRVGAFTEVADVLSGGTPKTDMAEYWNGEIPFFTPRDVPAGFYAHSTEKHVTELGLTKCASELYQRDTVFITARGTVGKVALASVPMAMNQSCYALRGKEGFSQRYLFLLTLDQVDYLKTNTGGATFDTIVVDTFRRMQVIVPSRDVIDGFVARVSAIFDQVDVLQRQTQNLRRTRDLLLPRLLSGHMDLATREVEIGS